MKLIVESGATKTAWRAVCKDGNVRAVQTSGLSPTCLDPEHIGSLIRKAVPVLNPEGERVERIFFYGAGLVSEDSAAPLRECLEMWCPFAEVEFHSDILAAARALFGDGSGVVAIMGTGSNSCLYSDGQIVRNIRPGGYVLGDEGSGVALGRAFLSDFVKGLLPQEIEREFVRETGLDYAQVVRKVYKEPAASAFMASLAPFVMAHISDPYVYKLVEECLESFVKRALARYSETCDDAGARKIGVIGSFGCACEEILREIGGKYGLEFVRFLKSPIEELVKYHGI
jgi:N-acetylglucosamine kinase-like BadF-type ATPase